MAVQTRHLRPVPNPEQRGEQVVSKLRALVQRTKKSAQRELLAELAQEYVNDPGRVMLSWEVADRLLELAGELER